MALNSYIPTYPWPYIILAFTLTSVFSWRTLSESADKIRDIYNEKSNNYRYKIETNPLEAEIERNKLRAHRSDFLDKYQQAIFLMRCSMTINITLGLLVIFYISLYAFEFFTSPPCPLQFAMEYVIIALVAFILLLLGKSLFFFSEYQDPNGSSFEGMSPTVLQDPLDPSQTIPINN